MNTIHFRGVNGKAIFSGAFILIVGSLILWRKIGWTETKQKLYHYVLSIAVPTLILFIMLFVYYGLQSPYYVYLSEFDRLNQQLTAMEMGKKSAESERDSIKDKLSKLQTKMNHIDHERARLEKKTSQNSKPIYKYVSLKSEPDPTSNKNEIRKKLGELLVEGNQLKSICLNQQNIAPESDALAWAKKTEDLLASSLGSEYVSLFRDDSDALPIYPTSIDKQHQQVWFFLNTRTVRLQQFLLKY